MMTVVVVSLAIGSVGLVSAQEVPANNSTISPTATETPTNETNSSAVVEGGGIVIDDTTRLTKWEYRDGTFYLSIEADRTAVLTVSEVVQPKRGAGEMSIQKKRVASGTTTIEIDVDRVAGHAAIAITTPDSLEDGRGVYVSTGQASGDSPLERTTSTAGWLGGASIACAMFGAAAWQRRHKDWDAVEEVK